MMVAFDLASLGFDKSPCVRTLRLSGLRCAYGTGEMTVDRGGRLISKHQLSALNTQYHSSNPLKTVVFPTQHYKPSFNPLSRHF